MKNGPGIKDKIILELRKKWLLYMLQTCYWKYLFAAGNTLNTWFPAWISWVHPFTCLVKSQKCGW